VLGIDNVIFISILAGKLPAHQQDFVRRFGVGVAAISRLLLLFWIAWIMGVTATWFSAFGQDISGRDVILIAGGLLLIYKAVNELHQRLEGATDAKGGAVQATLAGVMMQIFVLDMVFALDSIITAVGMVEDIRIMVVAIVLATIRMVLLASHLHRFVQRHPTASMSRSPKGYVHFAMGFAVFVELLNMWLRKVAQPPVALHEPYVGKPGPRR
jgi:predicted tellurium resistance membrane protein TerC